MNKSKYINIAFYIVIVLILIVFMIYIISKIDRDEIDDLDTNESELVIKKLDDTKDYVYDALYEMQTDGDSYYVDNNNMEIKASDIVVPYVNIDNNDARRVNSDIYMLYEELINNFNNNIKNKLFYTLVEYDSYINNNILSIVIYTESAGTSIPIYQYYTYNFDLITGKLFSYNDVLSRMNLDRNIIDEEVENIITDFLYDICDVQNCITANYTYEDFYNQSITSYVDRVNDGSLNFYIQNNQLYVVLNPQLPAQTSGNNKLFNISTGEEIR